MLRSILFLLCIMSVCCASSDVALEDNERRAPASFGRDLRRVAKEILPEGKAGPDVTKGEKSDYQAPTPAEQVGRLLTNMLPLINAHADNAAYQASAESFLCRAVSDKNLEIREKVLGFVCDNMPTNQLCSRALATLLGTIDKDFLNGVVPCSSDYNTHERYLLAGFIIHYISILQEQLVELGRPQIFFVSNGSSRRFNDIVARFDISAWVIALHQKEERIEQRHSRIKRRGGTVAHDAWSVMSFASTDCEGDAE